MADAKVRWARMMGGVKPEHTRWVPCEECGKHLSPPRRPGSLSSRTRCLLFRDYFVDMRMVYRRDAHLAHFARVWDPPLYE